VGASKPVQSKWFLLRVHGSDAVGSGLVKITLQGAEQILQRFLARDQLDHMTAGLADVAYWDARVWHYSTTPGWLDDSEPFLDSEAVTVLPPDNADFDDEVAVEGEQMHVTADHVYWAAAIKHSSESVETAPIERAGIEALLEEWAEKEPQHCPDCAALGRPAAPAEPCEHMTAEAAE
jgi:hypothetical protein